MDFWKKTFGGNQQKKGVTGLKEDHTTPTSQNKENEDPGINGRDGKSSGKEILLDESPYDDRVRPRPLVFFLIKAFLN